jgi:hypothetical protein
MTKIYETHNSLYEVDLEGMRYRRGPNEHTAYQAPELRNPQGSHRLVDGEWVALASEPQVVKDSWGDECLHIMAHDSTKGILTSPIQSVSDG